MRPSDDAARRTERPRTTRHGSSRRLAGLQLAEILSRNWLVLLMRGLIAVAFGVLALFLTKTWISVLILPFGTYALADGVLGAGIVLGERTGRGFWWVLLCWGLAGVAAGILTFFLPPGSALAFMCYIGIWAVVTGVLEVMTAISLRRKMGAEWLLVLAGVLSIGFGVSIIALSNAGAFTLARLIAAHCFVFGILLGSLAFRARGARLRSA